MTKTKLYLLIKKGYYFQIFLYFFSLNIHSQTQMNLKIKFDDSLIVEKYEPLQNEFKYRSIRIEPGNYRIENDAVPRILNDETIVGVDLIYTGYPEGEDLSELNRKRIIELYMSCPKAFNRQTIKWRLIKQTGVKNQADLPNYFHGFIVYFRPLVPFSEEKKYINDIISGKEKLKDSTLLKVFSRKSRWKEMLCVADVTGSMAPYTVQLMIWAKFNQRLKTFKQFVFFNDDEERSNDQSISLDSSGIWNVETYNAEKIMNTALTSMQKGGHFENDIEAIFYAIKKYPNNIKNILLIADNWEDPCDMALLPKLKELKIPISIIICGVNSVINTKYLEIAYATNGSIHTIEEDLDEMGKLNEGHVFKIGGLKYRLVNNKFLKI